MLDLPDEILKEIIEWTVPNSFYSLTRTCKKINTLCNLMVPVKETQFLKKITEKFANYFSYCEYFIAPNGKKNGLYKEWLDYGENKQTKEYWYKNGKKHGKCTKWDHCLKIIKTCYYKRGRREGIFVLYHDDGTLIEEAFYRKGKKHGLHKWYSHFKGQEEAFYRKGKKHGLCKWRYKNGQIVEETEYKLGVKHGLSKKWYENGQKKEVGHYSQGKLEGLYITWDENGREKSRRYYLEKMYLEWKKNGEINVIPMTSDCETEKSCIGGFYIPPEYIPYNN